MKAVLRLRNTSRVVFLREYSSINNQDGVLVAIPEIKHFVNRCMTKVGTNSKHANELAEVLVAADHRGHFSHGLNRLGEAAWLPRLCWIWTLALRSYDKKQRKKENL